ncbi:27271_t:CDS:2, partial [Racocetra persica]
SNYLQETLYLIQYIWALWYQSLWFTAGIQSSQRIEALNALLKTGVDHTSSLYHLYEKYQRLFDNQSEYSQLEEYQNSIPTRGLPIASQFVIPHILSIQRQQINESLLYCAACLEVSEFNNNKLESDVPDSNFTKDLNDYPRILLSSLLENVNYNDQQISYVNLLSSYSYISLAIATDITTSPEEMHNSFNLEYLKQMRSNNMMSSEMSHNVSKKMRYLTRFGVLKKALNLSISLNCDDELLNILYHFIGNKQKLSTNYSTINNNNNKDHTNTNQNSDNSYIPIQITDPLVVRKREGSSNQLKSSTEYNNIITKYKKQALAPLNENIQLNKFIFKESNNIYNEVNQDNKFSADNQVCEGDAVNKYKCRVCGSFEHNAQNKKKCSQQNSL